MIKYFVAPDIKKLVDDIVDVLDFSHVDSRFVHCFRSTGSKSRYVIARIHGLGKIWQKTLQISPVYIIEVISERYDKLSENQKEKILIHELLHIPKGFSGGFLHHKGHINQRIIDRLHCEIKKNRLNRKYR